MTRRGQVKYDASGLYQFILLVAANVIADHHLVPSWRTGTVTMVTG